MTGFLEIFGLLIAGMGNQNWIYILAARKIHSSQNATHRKQIQELTMTTTTVPRFEAANETSTFSRLVSSFLAEVRRAIELAGAPYVNGPLPPL
jgi:hypothetical protein